MRTGNGKHRRPRQAPAIVVAAGVTGASIAMPLLGATGAHAADASTWDRVAQCESGGMWSSNGGNGYYGGLQLTLETWKQYEGTSYAPRPDLASRSQQISVAEAILGDKGPDAWPSCAVNGGLLADGAAPDVDPGSTTRPSTEPTDGASDDATAAPDAAKSAKPSDGATGKATPDSDASDAAKAKAKAKAKGESQAGAQGAGGDAEKTPAPGASKGADDPTSIPGPVERSESAAAGKHRGDTDASGSDEEAGDVADFDRSGGRHASRDGGAERAGGLQGGGYTVRSGDSLSAIAARQDVHGGWSSLYDANAKVVGSDPDLIRPGQQLDLSQKPG
ncbi:LysM peptidoglycan-binding domain-containing protein [Streptomyces sp. H27-D2]|uniref:LysM peptidoglycan-binding domain-containing protein n=1 Tax=Streptomyces sp. H27-D2 TaxID=3046304 RepID=UPI002DBA307C|nr:transglycosylase family protein [Streptomyces sp. H27-D2]MEC4017313.1 transglycosylase family protein [Streptomyces sp. H27-D2]